MLPTIITDDTFVQQIVPLYILKAKFSRKLLSDNLYTIKLDGDNLIIRRYYKSKVDGIYLFDIYIISLLDKNYQDKFLSIVDRHWEK